MAKLVTKARRSELDKFDFGECSTCHETVIWARIKSSLQMIPLDPEPTHGTEIDRGYARHFCKKDDEE